MRDTQLLQDNINFLMNKTFRSALTFEETFTRYNIHTHACNTKLIRENRKNLKGLIF